MIHRKRFKYTLIDVFNYISRCIYCRDLKANRHKKKFKNHFLYEKCEEALKTELDVVSLLRQARKTKLLTQILLNQRQKMLLRFQRKNLVETSTSSQDSDNERSKFDTVKLMDSKNPLIRLSMIGRLKRMIT